LEETSLTGLAGRVAVEMTGSLRRRMTGRGGCDEPEAVSVRVAKLAVIRRRVDLWFRRCALEPESTRKGTRRTRGLYCARRLTRRQFSPICAAVFTMFSREKAWWVMCTSDSSHSAAKVDQSPKPSFELDDLFFGFPWFLDQSAAWIMSLALL
jgi:hypothetical protein